MRVDAKTAHLIATGKITALIQPGRIKQGRHRIMFERKRTYEDGPNPNAEETIWQMKCWIAVTDRIEKPLRDVTYEEAKAAGYGNLDVFRSAWEEDREWLEFGIVYVHRFEVVHENQDPVLLLARVSGYTSDPNMAIDELEAVSAVAQKAMTKEAQVYDHLREQQRRKRWENRTTEDRLRAAKAEAVARSIDISHHERVIEDRLDRIERQLGKGKAA